MKYLYRAYFGSCGEVEFDNFKVIRETKRNYFIKYQSKEKKVLKPCTKNGKIKNAFARETRIEAFNDLYVRSQISLSLLQRRAKYLKNQIQVMQREIKFYEIEEKDIKYGNKKLVIDDRENVQKMDKDLELGDFNELLKGINNE